MHYPVNKSAIVIVCVAFCLLGAVYPQQPAERADLTLQGIALYERGETEEAIKTLRKAVGRSNEDARAWHYLGLALVRQGTFKEAREAFEKAISLQSRSLDEAVGRRPEREWRDDQLSNLKTLLNEQIETQTRLLEIVIDKQALEKGQLALERSRIQADCMEQNTKLVDGHTVLSKSDMRIKRPRILFRTEPAFPESARQARLNGTVILKAVFATDGTVKFIERIQSSGEAFSEEAIRAALKTRFQPGSICGKPVSFPLQLEYSFNISER